MVREEKLIEEIGRRMVKKCGNLPLAISLLGGVLQKEISVEKWKSIEMDINTSLDGEMEEVLDLSFDELPHHLKLCFLYMGFVLEEDESIYGRDLYNMWIAQGMIPYEGKRKNDILMDTAECYMLELVSRYLVQYEFPEIDEGNRYAGEFKLHDVVWKLCFSKGRKEGFGVHSLDYRGGDFDNLWDESLRSIKVRHVAINFEQEIDAENPRRMPTNDTMKHIRSLLLVNKTRSTIGIPMIVSDIHEFKLLKVLIFSKISFKGRKLLRKIGNLIHLRELRLKECELDDELPSSICNLRYLIILDLERSQNVKMPTNLKNISRLRFLNLPRFEIEICKDNHIPLGGLVMLEILFNFDSRLSDFKPLLSMKNLRFLHARVHDNRSLSSIIDATSHHWKSFHKLTLDVYEGCKFTMQDREGLMILQKLFTCPPLKRLVLFAQIGEFPEECKTQMVASSLVYLHLNGCRIEKDPMMTLGQIPSLKVLSMELNSFMGETMMCPASSFPKLKVLQLIKLPNLKEWKLEQGAMPLLSHLLISYCSKLVMLHEGLRFLKLLEELTIEGMPEMGRRVSVQEEGEDYDKVSHIPSILILE